jgi:F0F1-type ATP synthase epsilon subunit
MNLNFKFLSQIKNLYHDQVTVIDLTHAELGDQGVISLTELIVSSLNIKLIKLDRNCISDIGAVFLLN